MKTYPTTDQHHDSYLYSETEYRVPGTGIALMFVWLLLTPYAIVLWLIRHAVLVATIAALMLVWQTAGPIAVAGLVGAAVVALIVARVVNRDLYNALTAKLSIRARGLIIYRSQWRRTMRELELTRSDKITHDYPTLLRVMSAGPHTDRLVIHALRGQTSAVWQDSAAALARAFGAAHVRVKPGRRGTVLLDLTRDRETVLLDLTRDAVRLIDDRNHVPATHVQPHPANTLTPAYRAREGTVSHNHLTQGSIDV